MIFNFEQLLWVSPAILLMLWAQFRIRSAYARGMQIPASLSGAAFLAAGLAFQHGKQRRFQLSPGARVKVSPHSSQVACARVSAWVIGGPPARKGHGRDKQGTKQGHKGHKRKGRTGHPPYRGCPYPPECSRLSLRQGEAGSFLTPCHWRINPLAHAGLDFAGGL